MSELKINEYRPHDDAFLQALAVALLDGKAQTNWGVSHEYEDVVFLPVKQAPPDKLAEISARCSGLYFFAKTMWAMPVAVRGMPVFHTVEPLSRAEALKLVDMYKDEKARRIANGTGD